MRNRVSCAAVAILTLLLSNLILATPASALFEKRKARGFMANGEYQSAITEFEKIAHKKDLEMQLDYAYCLMKVGQTSKATEKFKAIKSAYNGASDKIAQLCLKLTHDETSTHSLNRLLEIAGRYATVETTRKEIGEMTLRLANYFNGGQKIQLMNRASQYLGHGAVFGFETEQLNENRIKITFLTDRPVDVLEWKKGVTISFIEVSNPESILRYYRHSNKSEQIALNFPLTAKSGAKILRLKGNPEGYIILESINFPINKLIF